MDYEPKDVMVLGAIRSGARRFEKIRKATRLDPKELDSILASLEKRGMIRIQEKKTWLGRKIEISTTDRGDTEVEQRIHELQSDWQQMVQVYKGGDKKKMTDKMDNYKGLFPMMIFFGIVDIMMFSMMFSMIGASMTDYVPADQVPDGMDGADGGADSGMMDDGGFDIGF